MDSWWWLLRWCAGDMMWYVGVAMVVRRCLVPWALWLGRRVTCWCRYALPYSRPLQSWTPTCPCCDGVNFDGMEGRWAVVTGCTDGIGKEYALQLADRRINVALVSRNLDKLRAVAHEIRERHAGAVRTLVVAADFTSSGGTVPLDRTYDAVRRALDGLDVALLVNNAGLSYARPERLLDLPSCCSGTPTCGGVGDPCRDVIECNVLAAVAMCRIAMPLMDTDAADGQRDRDRPDVDDELKPSNRGRGGVVINVSSISAHLPCPLLTVYGATKAFVEKFSIELAAEYDGGADGKHGTARSPRIAVRCLAPGYVATKMSGIRPGTTGNVGWTPVPGPATYARHSLRSLGCHCGCGRIARRGHGIGHRRDETGWLANAAAAVLDSPSSPFSIGRPGIGTTGYTAHTLTVMAMNVARWAVGDAYVSRAVCRMMCRNRDRMARRHAKAAKDAVRAVPEQRDR
ncbi:very-long-chain 3-oxoacyl-CoA reductase-like [Sipha flava]|uniref:Estradiol 17-beta-dehydrogenase 12 n=1 Tax=Sipha flava TaxID=143950 RepID=A0A2S2QTX4_9HEMI|nr:very-long-chain 3-oxoacyl-CoA reductase-like [Sipha flava]